MDIIPFIDIVEPARIDSLLADPDNFTWRAIDSETLGTWTPDLGVTSYPNPSIFRPSAIARSGMESTLRHRFWGTVEHQTDHTGQRYIGILMYAAADEECSMEIRLASDYIGRVEPSRHDNRLHLIVLDTPVEFMGEMEIFQLTAPGPGTYRIEQFVLLKERPQPSRFIPTIEHLRTSRIDQNDGQYGANLHFITSEMATTQVQLHVEDQLVRQIKQTNPTTLHCVPLSDLEPETLYTATVTAREAAGETASEHVSFEILAQWQAWRDDLSIPVELFNLASADLTGLPLTFGVPLPAGTAYEATAFQLETPAGTWPVQTRTHARWPDHSARWLLVDAVVPSALAETHSVEARLRTASSALPAMPGLTTESSKTDCTVISENLRVSVHQNTGLSIMQRRDDQRHDLLQSLSFVTTLGNGLSLKPGPVQNLVMEEAGHQRAVIRFSIPHEDENGTAHLQSTIRLQVYAGQSFVKLVHRLEVISPSLAPAATGGDLPDHASSHDIRSAIAGTTGEESTLLRLCSFAITLPWAGATSIQALGQSWQVQDRDWGLKHEHDLEYRITEDGTHQNHKGQAKGHIRIAGTPGTLGVGIRNFWQIYPKGIAVTPDGVQIQLFPALSDDVLPGDEDAGHRLYFWLKEGSYLLKSGMALTSEILLDFDGENEAVFDWLERPPMARPAIGYVNEINVLNPIAPKANSSLPDYETLTDQALESFQQDRAHFRAYGQVNFGDWYGESGWSWGNNEYDPAYCAYVEFLRGGEPGWAVWGAESVGHLVDVDTLNFSSDESEIGGQAMHMPGHLGGYLPPLFRSKMGGTKSIPSHTWVEGPLLHYLLTGDETVHETIEKTKQWLLQKHWFDYYDFSNCRESGWHIIHLCMLATATNDLDCQNAAAIIVRRVLEKQAPGGGWVRMLTESHCGCGYPRCRGEAGFMVGVLLSGLKRYYHLTGDERVAEAIVGGARWLIKHTYDEKSGYFRYTSCENRTLGGGFQQTQWVLEGLADAYEISGDPEIGRYVEDGLKAVGLFPEGVEHLGLGKAISQQMRYIPTVLAALD